MSISFTAAIRDVAGRDPVLDHLVSLRDLSVKVMSGDVVLGASRRTTRPYRSVVARYCWEATALFRGGTDPSLR